MVDELSSRSNVVSIPKCSSPEDMVFSFLAFISFALWLAMISLREWFALVS